MDDRQDEVREESIWRPSWDVPSIPLMAAALVVLGLSYLTLIRGETFRFWVHDGLALVGAILLFYAAHAPPTPEMWRRRLIVFGGLVSIASMISG
jgi:hypothetical protein